MGLFEQLPDADQKAASQLAKYLIETEGNRFYKQNLAEVRNHIAGNDQLIREAHKFQKKLAEMMQQQAQAVTAIGQRIQQATTDPVADMMRRYHDPKSRKAFMDKVERMIKQRATQKRLT